MHSLAMNGQSNVLLENFSALRDIINRGALRVSIDKAYRAWVDILESLDRRAWYRVEAGVFRNGSIDKWVWGL